MYFFDMPSIFALVTINYSQKYVKRDFLFIFYMVQPQNFHLLVTV